MSPAQKEAVARFAKRHGRNWKSALRRRWLSDARVDGDDALLRQVRNDLGPAWLAKAKAPAIA